MSDQPALNFMSDLVEAGIELLSILLVFHAAPGNVLGSPTLRRSAHAGPGKAKPSTSILEWLGSAKAHTTPAKPVTHDALEWGK